MSSTILLTMQAMTRSGLPFQQWIPISAFVSRALLDRVQRIAGTDLGDHTQGMAPGHNGGLMDGVSPPCVHSHQGMP